MKKLIALFLTFIIICSCLSACGSSSGGYSDKLVAVPESSIGATTNGSFGFDSSADIVVDDSFAEKVPDQSSQKLVYTASINVETKSFDDSAANIRSYVSEMGGYIERTESYSYNESTRSAYFKVRIPAESYQEFLNAVCEIGRVRHKSENVEDITSSYLDVEARLESLESKMARLMELQEGAESLDHLLMIETQISDTQYQIESYTSTLNYMKNQVSYCTVNVNLEEVVVYSQKPSFGSEIREAHSDTIDGFIRFLKNFVLFVIYVYPYAIIIALGIVLAVYIRKKHKSSKIGTKKIPVPSAKKGKEVADETPVEKE